MNIDECQFDESRYFCNNMHACIWVHLDFFVCHLIFLIIWRKKKNNLNIFTARYIIWETFFLNWKSRNLWILHIFISKPTITFSPSNWWKNCIKIIIVKNLNRTNCSCLLLSNSQTFKQASSSCTVHYRLSSCTVHYRL